MGAGSKTQGNNSLNECPRSCSCGDIRFCEPYGVRFVSFIMVLLYTIKIFLSISFGIIHKASALAYLSFEPFGMSLSTKITRASSPTSAATIIP